MLILESIESVDDTSSRLKRTDTRKVDLIGRVESVTHRVDRLRGLYSALLQSRNPRIVRVWIVPQNIDKRLFAVYLYSVTAFRSSPSCCVHEASASQRALAAAWRRAAVQ
jgi:hypothetical protein